MRSLSSTLEDAQKAKSIEAIYKIVLTEGENTYTYEQDRILPSSHNEELYSHRATIVLDNSDGEFDDKDLKGYQGVISYGAVGKAGAKYSATAPVWVIDQQFNSQPGKLTCELELEGIPDLMAEDEASANYIPDDTDTKTVKTLVNAIAGATLSCFSHCKAFDVVWDAGYDTLADTYKPKDSFRVYTGGARLAALRRVLDFTANVPRFEDDGKIHILKPVTTGTDYDYEYNLESGHTFFSKAFRNSLVIPNRVVVKSRSDDDPSYSGSAQIDGYADLPEEVKKTSYIQVRLESNAQANSIAEAMIAKAEMWSERGAAEVPMNVGAELFDYVKVTDQRQGDSRTGNLGYVHRKFGAGKWSMTFSFGNWVAMLRYRKMLKELETYTEAGNYFERLVVGNLYAENIQADNIDLIWLDPEGNVDLSQIGDNLDSLPDGELYARVKSLHLDAGQIKLDEYVYYKAGYDPTDKFDLADNDLDDIPEGVIYQRVKSSALTADGLVILDEVYVDSEAGTYGLTLQTDLSAGHLKLTSETVIDGLWYSESGVDIDATNGVTITGGKLTLKDSGGGHAAQLYIDTTGYLRIDPWIRTVCKGLYPVSTDGYNIGAVGSRWLLGVFKDLQVYDLYFSSGGRLQDDLIPEDNDDLYVGNNTRYFAQIWATYSLAKWLKPRDEDHTGYVGTGVHAWLEMNAYHFYTASPRKVENALTKLLSVKADKDGVYDKSSFPGEVVKKAEDPKEERESVIASAEKRALRLENRAKQADKVTPGERTALINKAKSIRDKAQEEANGLVEHDRLDLGGWLSMLQGGLEELSDRLEALEAKLGVVGW